MVNMQPETHKQENMALRMGAHIWRVNEGPTFLSFQMDQTLTKWEAFALTMPTPAFKSIWYSTTVSD